MIGSWSLVSFLSTASDLVRNKESGEPDPGSGELLRQPLPRGGRPGVAQVVDGRFDDVDHAPIRVLDHGRAIDWLRKLRSWGQCYKTFYCR